MSKSKGIADLKQAKQNRLELKAKCKRQYNIFYKDHIEEFESEEIDLEGNNKFTWSDDL